MGMQSMKIESVVNNMELLTPFSADLAFSAVTIAVSEAFLLPAAENGYPKNPFFWHQVRSLMFIAKPRRWRPDSNHNIKLQVRFQSIFA